MNRHQACHLAVFHDKNKVYDQSWLSGASSNIKSIKTKRPALAAISNGRKGFCNDGVIFTHWQILHLRIQFFAMEPNVSQDIAAKIFSRPKWLPTHSVAILEKDLCAHIRVVGNDGTRSIDVVDAVQKLVTVKTVSLNKDTLGLPSALSLGAIDKR